MNCHFAPCAFLLLCTCHSTMPQLAPIRPFMADCEDPREYGKVELESDCVTSCWSWGNWFRTGTPPRWSFEATAEQIELLSRGVVFVGGGKDIEENYVWEDLFLMPECPVTRRFEPLEGTPESSAEVFVSTRALVRPDEIVAGCERATHVVVAYSAVEKHVTALVIPVPCPADESLEPHRWCRYGDTTYTEERLQSARENEAKRRAFARRGHWTEGLIDYYADAPSMTLPFMADFLEDVDEPLSCFIAAEARQQLEHPDADPIEWTDTDLTGCEAIAPFDVCFPLVFRPERLAPEQCPELLNADDYFWR